MRIILASSAPMEDILKIQNDCSPRLAQRLLRGTWRGTHTSKGVLKGDGRRVGRRSKKVEKLMRLNFRCAGLGLGHCALISHMMITFTAPGINVGIIWPTSIESTILRQLFSHGLKRTSRHTGISTLSLSIQIGSHRFRQGLDCT